MLLGAMAAQRILHALAIVFRRCGASPSAHLAIAVISGIYILFVYSNGIEMISRMSVAGTYFARLLLYLIFIVSIGASCAYVAKHKISSRASCVLFGYVALLSGIVVYHVVFKGDGMGLATKSFVAGLLQIIGFGFLLGVRPARRTVDMCAIVVLICSCLLCLVDVLFWGVFSEIPGRGAGLYVNPNLAALAMLLGVLGIVGCLGPYWRLSVLSAFLLGLFATLSRSGFLAAAFVGLACMPSIYVEVRKNYAIYCRGLILAAVILLAGSSYLTYVYFSGSPFVVKMMAAKNNVVGSVMEAKREPTSEPVENSAIVNSSEATSGLSGCGSWTVVFRGLKQANTCAWLDPKVIEKHELENSVVARILLALRGIAAISDAPWLGSGLDRAFSLRPHNTYLLFGIAYGVVGMFFVPVFGLFIFLRMHGWQQGLPLLVFLFFASCFSHDIFLSRDLVAGLAIVLSSGDRSRVTT